MKLNLNQSSAIRLGFYVDLAMTIGCVIFYMVTRSQNGMVKDILITFNGFAWPAMIGRHYIDSRKGENESIKS